MLDFRGLASVCEGLEFRDSEILESWFQIFRVLGFDFGSSQETPSDHGVDGNRGLVRVPLTTSIVAIGKTMTIMSILRTRV